MIQYLIAFLTVVVINVVPMFMPPTWIVLTIFYNNGEFDPLLLAFVGAVASLTGRIMLTHMSIFSRRFISKARKKSLDTIKIIVDKNPVKSFFATLLFALSPFPSNVYFITLGLAKSRSVAVFAGFFIGRLISYYVLILTATIIFRQIRDIIAGTWEQLFFTNMAALVLMVLFVMIDWDAFIRKRKIKFI
jgi:hypothetical protein